MKKLFSLLVLVLAAGACNQPVAKNAQATSASIPAAVEGGFTSAEFEAFTALNPIDSHAHVFATDPAFIAMLERLHVHLLDICVVGNHADPQKRLLEELLDARQFIAASHGHAALCTTFNPYAFREPGFDEAVIRQLDQNFAEGAVAVKIWKNIGMELKDARGRYVMPDDPIFEPIYRDIAAHDKTLVAHLAEPDSCWQPLNPASPDYWYYTHNPQWYMYGKPNAASKADILRARDHLLAENPKLRVVGAHLGSMESNFEELGQHFDRYSNFAVDMAARMPYVMMQPHDRVIAFILKYQDRLLYGTDLGFRPGGNETDAIESWEKYYAHVWRFLATQDTVEYEGKHYQGLALPQAVLQKIYHDNAVRWIPGILGEQH